MQDHLAQHKTSMYAVMPVLNQKPVIKLAGGLNGSRTEAKAPALNNSPTHPTATPLVPPTGAASATVEDMEGAKALLKINTSEPKSTEDSPKNKTIKKNSSRSAPKVNDCNGNGTTTAAAAPRAGGASNPSPNKDPHTIGDRKSITSDTPSAPPLIGTDAQKKRGKHPAFNNRTLIAAKLKMEYPSLSMNLALECVNAVCNTPLNNPGAAGEEEDLKKSTFSSRLTALMAVGWTPNDIPLYQDAWGKAIELHASTERATILRMVELAATEVDIRSSGSVRRQMPMGSSPPCINTTQGLEESEVIDLSEDAEEYHAPAKNQAGIKSSESITCKKEGEAEPVPGKNQGSIRPRVAFRSKKSDTTPMMDDMVHYGGGPLHAIRLNGSKTSLPAPVAGERPKDLPRTITPPTIEYPTGVITTNNNYHKCAQGVVKSATIAKESSFPLPGFLPSARLESRVDALEVYGPKMPVPVSGPGAVNELVRRPVIGQGSNMKPTAGRANLSDGQEDARAHLQNMLQKEAMLVSQESRLQAAKEAVKNEFESFRSEMQRKLNEAARELRKNQILMEEIQRRVHVGEKRKREYETCLAELNSRI